MKNSGISGSKDAPHFSPAPTSALHRLRGFTLVEVVLAIAVVAFAFVGMFSLLPVGLGVFRESMDISITAQIAQRIVSEAEQSDFDSLVPEAGNAVEGVTLGGADERFFTLPLRYFDDQGTELGLGDGTKPIPVLSDPEKQRVIYTARIRGSLPGEADPSAHNHAYFASLPARGDDKRFSPRFATFLTIQIVKNPGRLNLKEFIDPATFLLSPRLAREKNLPLKAYPAIVARNAYRNAD